MKQILIPLAVGTLFAVASTGVQADLFGNLNNRLNQTAEKVDAVERSADEQLNAARSSTDSIDTLTGSNLSSRVDEANTRKSATSDQADQVEGGARSRLNALRNLTGSAD